MRKAGGLTSPAFVLYSNEQAELRNKLIDRVDVLNKVKELFLIPKLEMIPTRMVADFYEVDLAALHRCFQRHKAEIVPDGVITLTNSEFEGLEHNVQVYKKPNNNSIFVRLNNGNEYEVACRSIYFSPRAVLRIGMLLRDRCPRVLRSHAETPSCLTMYHKGTALPC